MLIEFNLGIKYECRPTFIRASRLEKLCKELIALQHTYKYCFAWNYDEMFGLHRVLVEHSLPIMLGFMLQRQPL